MDTKANQRLPLWWILILAPLGYAGTNLFHWLASPEIQELTGIGQYRIFSLLVYTLATGIAVIVYMVLLKNRGMTMKAAYCISSSSVLEWQSGFCFSERHQHGFTAGLTVYIRVCCSMPSTICGDISYCR